MIVTIITLTENERTPGRHVGRPFCPPVIKEKRYERCEEDWDVYVNVA